MPSGRMGHTYVRGDLLTLDPHDRADEWEYRGSKLAEPLSVDRRQLPAVAPEPSVEEAPVPDLLGSILSGQSLLLMSSADVVIHRDGSLSAKRAGEHPWGCRPSLRIWKRKITVLEMDELERFSDFVLSWKQHC